MGPSTHCFARDHGVGRRVKPIGSECRIRYTLYDGSPQPGVGDVLVSSASAYLVIASRPIKRRIPGPRRFELKCLRAAPDEPGINRYTLVWDKRKKAGQ